MDRGNSQAARQRLERAIEHGRKALAALPHHPEYRRRQTDCFAGMTQVYRALKQPAEAVRLAREWAELVHWEPTRLYNVACTLARCVPLVPEDQKQPLASEAIQILKAATAAGWNDTERTSGDTDLLPLRDRDDFRRLVAEMSDHGVPANPFVPSPS